MKNTFGSSKAAQTLEGLISSNPYARRGISTILSQYSNMMLNITCIKNPQTVRCCLELLRDYTLRRIDIKKHLTAEMRSYAKNVVVFRYRMFRQAFDLRLDIW